MQNIVIDIAHRGVVPPICVTEYDAMSRFFRITLLDNGVPYTPPTDAVYSVRYAVGLNTGWYDTITVPGGTNRGAVSAWERRAGADDPGRRRVPADHHRHQN